ncbi:RecQ family ATP-dependent DNA helicase [Shouchella miscanthi]|uniref:ATP-dependent DNA helicase RecQ n=1 Tax=Shouchella miscanthi TaxID=2598861 RepID=A0ABU6NFZ9_9BACI|nr:RecQ family ATP-dependent DNA helicase [Shouchella miscanthi]MED4127113.1 RecQ family ATP-dependent DNA helicase [Shouchella miscanthi]
MLERELQRLFGFQTFKEGQKEIIEALMAGNDVFAMLPTGRGKSLCYQLPAFLARGLTVVVSPLLSLMEDQVAQLKKAGRKQVVALNSFSSKQERQKLLQQLNDYKIVYLSPEMLQAQDVLSALRSQLISYFIIDEAHCISYWGHDFRADYLRLREVKAALDHPPTLAITATADENVRKDIKIQLQLRQPVEILDRVNRENIALFVERYETNEQKVIRLKEIVREYELPGLVYAQTRAQAEWYCEQLQRDCPELSVGYYHGGMDSMDRMLVQEQFLSNQLDLICATNAFGMGVNKQDIRFIIHLQQPLDVASYLQEIGRAGRDGSPSFALVLLSPEDPFYASRLIQNRVEETMSLDTLPQLLAMPFNSKSEQRMRLEQSYGEQGQTILFLLEKWDVIVDDKGTWKNQHETISKLKTYFEKQEQRRQHRLDTMTEYSENHNQCRRHLLLHPFDEHVRVQAICCDICGATLDSFQKQKHESTKDIFQWDEELANIFNQPYLERGAKR